MALEIEGDGAYNCLNRGRIYMILGQYDAAEKALLKAVDKKEDEARVYLAQIYTLQQDADSAQKMVDAYLESKNVSSEGLTLLGQYGYGRSGLCAGAGVLSTGAGLCAGHECPGVEEK